MKRIYFKSVLILVLSCIIGFLVASAQPADRSMFKGKFNFYVVNDMGRNGYYDHKPIAELMGNMAEQGADPEFVVALGDVHHFNGVESTSDPLWMTNYELIYSHPELMLDWFTILGNHEYRGNTQACLDYTNISRRWEMNSRYYTKVFEDKGMTLRLIWIDTTPMMSKYRTDNDTYPDVASQDYQKQLAWLDSVLTQAKEDWTIVMGHHPLYAETSKDEEERLDMQATVGKVLSRHHVDMYINGHIHNFQHLRIKGSDIDYITNSAASLSRKVKPVEGTVFCSSEPGFSIVSADKSSLVLRMIDKQGNVLHTVTRSK